jgi:biopolymer transport protein ExbD
MAVRLDHGEDTLSEVHEINVTPFIDVILVLLIIFMVAAPLATVDVPVNLPSSNTPQQPRPEKPVIITLKPDLSLTLGENPIPRDALAAAIEQAVQGKKDTPVYLRADKAVSYGDLMALMNLLRDAGYLKIALMTLQSAQ